MAEAIVTPTTPEISHVKERISKLLAMATHERGKARDSALDAAWFGEGANLKDRAFTVARELIHV